MIHPFAPFNAANFIGRAPRERLDLIHKPITDFADYLHGRNRTAPGTQETRSADPEPVNPNSLAPKKTANPAPQQRTESESPDQAHTQPIPPRTRGTPTTTLELPPDPEGWLAAKGAPLRYTHVPDAAKYPAGPYRQAPPEFGGEWWLVNPFTGDTPWAVLTAPSDPTSHESPYATENLPAGFVDAFGEKPVLREGEEAIDFIGRLSRWKQDLHYFQKTGIPEGFDEMQITAAANNFEQWGLGRPVFYEGRYGWFARFPQSALPEFEIDAASAIESSHIAIARYQVRLMQQGTLPDAAHPFVPPRLLTSA